MDGARLFSDLMVQAFAQCGNDRACIEAFFEERAQSLTMEEKKALDATFRRVIGFDEPQKPFSDN